MNIFKLVETPNKLTYHFFRDRFWICFALTLPILFYSTIFERWSGFALLDFPGSKLIPLILGSIVFFYSGLTFILGAVHEIKEKKPGLMLLTAIAICSAYAFSLLSQVLPIGEEFFWETSLLISFMLLGRWLELRSLSSSEVTLEDLNKLLPELAQLKNGRLVFLKELAAGDVVVVKPGEIIPVDGVIENGESEINESLLSTGEVKHSLKSVGSKVLGGMKNISGNIEVRATRLGASSYLEGVIRTLIQARENKTKIQILADRAALWLTVTAIVSAVITAISWVFIGGSLGTVLDHVVSVLVVACPNALILAVPLTVAVTTKVGAEHHILIRTREALEELRKVTTVVFDKTGTLLTNNYILADCVSTEGLTEQEVVGLAAAVESRSEHALGKAIVNKANEWGLNLPVITNFKIIPGVCVEAEYEGKKIRVGGKKLLEQQKPTMDEALSKFDLQFSQIGVSVMYVVRENTVIGLISLEDSVKPETISAITELKKMGILVVMLTGDNNSSAERVARTLGVSEFYGELLPEMKEAKISELKAKGGKVAFVGDGINDIAVLAKSDLGIIIGSESEANIESAGVILTNDNPMGIPQAIKLSRLNFRMILQNLWWAIGYNILAIIFAAGVLSSFSIEIPSALGPLFMSLSAIIVAVNAQTIRTRRL